MDPRNAAFPAHVSPQYETITLAVSPRTKTSFKSRSYISCRTSSGIPRNSSVTVSSESIKVFVDVNDLPSRSGSKNIKPAEPETSYNYPPLDPTFHQKSRHSSDSMSTFRFGEIPEPLQGPVETPREEDVTQAAVNRRQFSRQSSFRSLWRPRSTTENERDLYETFPRPPSKLLLQVARVFPEAPQYKQPVYVEKSLPPPPYHVFDITKKKRILYMVAIVGMLTPLSAFVYLPALGDISREFNLSWALVLLTITVHMASQGIAPLIWMPLCDYFGRRLTLIATLVVFVGANAGLLFAKKISSLMLLRAAQAFGSAYLSTLAAAVIGDISTGEERGELIGVFRSLLLFGHVISPVLGGVLTRFFGFRSIFWLQLALGGIAFSLVVLLLPETLRNIAGNGTIRLKPYQQPLFAVINSSPDARFDPNPDTITLKPTVKSFVEPLYQISHINVLGSILFGAIAFATSVIVISTTALFLESNYRLSTLLVGVAFLPSGAGIITSFFLISHLLDRDYKIVESRYKVQHGIEEGSNMTVKNNPDFPIERARLRNIWWITILFIGATIGYGFSLSSKHIVIPLVLQFFTAFGATAILLLNGVLIADLCGENSASATAVVNLVRFCMGALAVGVVQLLFDRVGAGFTFLIFAMATLAVTPVLVVQWIFGVKWRTEERKSSESRTFLGRLQAVKQSGIFGKLPSWREVWERMRVKNQDFLSLERKRWMKVPDWEEIGDKIRINYVLLTAHNLWIRVPGWRNIRGKVHWRSRVDHGLQPASFLP